MRFQKLTNIGYGILAVAAALAPLAPLKANALEVFTNPKIRGRDVDRCINSPSYQDGACSQSAMQLAANTFCEYQGYSEARDFRYFDYPHGGNGQYSWDVVKLTERRNGGRNSRPSFIFEETRGSWIFEEIACDSRRSSHREAESPDLFETAIDIFRREIFQ